MAQETIRSSRGETETVETDEAAIKHAQEVGSTALEGTKEDIDSLLDEIDEVLEENASEYVNQFMQRGGQ
jgi:ubiquitin-like protein Pup